MKSRVWLILWGCLFIVCAGLGFIPEPEGIFGTVTGVASALFFLPPAVLLAKGERRTAALVRNFSALSLGLTALLLVVNFMTVLSSEFLGRAAYYVLVIVSAPMVASGHWALSMFAWACLLFASLRRR